MKKILFVTILTWSVSCMSQSKSSRNGFYYPPYGTTRILFAFADVNNDPCDETICGWVEGQLPQYKDSLIDIAASLNMQYGISKYFQQSSFGILNFIGDYCGQLLSFNYNSFSTDIRQQRDSIAHLLATNFSTNTTEHGFYLQDFDNWDLQTKIFEQYSLSTDNYIDLIVVVWRRNTKFRKHRTGGEYFDSTHTEINNFDGVSHWIYTCIDNNVAGCIRHELAHCLLGGNAFHSGGAGTGEGNFLSNIGGYSILGSYNANLNSCNGWDRWRLGWMNPKNQYYISARNTTDRSEVETDLEYGETLTENEFVLRDFIKYGDAIRIKLPYLQTMRPYAKNQYLWIENHQLLPGSIEEDNNKPKGIRFNIQIGNDQLDNSASRTNYIVPLSAFGNYDFDYYCNPDSVPQGQPRRSYYTAATTSQSANPFTGYHLSMSPAIDTTPTDNVINCKEYVGIWNVLFNGEEILTGHPVFGNPYDAFSVGQSLRLASNPSNTPLLTYRTGYRTSDYNNPTSTHPETDDNRHIFLNGLRIDIVEQYPEDEGSIKVRIRWDDFDVDRDVRWCDSIILTEQVNLKPGHSITLDQGRTPVQPCNPMQFNNRSIFADPTVLTCKTGSLFKQETSSTVNVINNSTLEVESGATYEVGDNAVLYIKKGATLHLKQGSTLRVKGRGHVEIENGGYICIEDGVSVILENILSTVNLHDNCLFGTRYNPSMSFCTSTPLTQFPHMGNGSINVFQGNEYIQNKTFTQSSYYTGDNIRAGHHVTDQTPHGNVVIQNGTNVILDGENAIYLEPGVEVMKGGTLEAR